VINTVATSESMIKPRMSRVRPGRVEFLIGLFDVDISAESRRDYLVCRKDQVLRLILLAVYAQYASTPMP
jgi:hypothetical protein